jgi:hypothetical protein
MSLTHAGYQFLRHAHQILASVRHAREALSTRPDAVTGQLNIGVTSLVCGYFLPYLLERFRSTFPQVEVRVVEDQRDYIEHLLVNGELDAAVFIVSNVQNRQALHTEVLQQSSYRLWLPSGHRLLDGGMVTLSDLADQPLVALKLDELEDVATACGGRLAASRNWRCAPLRWRPCVAWWLPGPALPSCRMCCIAPGRWKGTGWRCCPCRKQRRRWRLGWCGGAACRFLTTRITSLPWPESTVAATNRPSPDICLIDNQLILIVIFDK